MEITANLQYKSLRIFLDDYIKKRKRKAVSFRGVSLEELGKDDLIIIIQWIVDSYNL